MINNPKIFKAKDVEVYFNSNKVENDSELYCQKIIQQAKVDAKKIKEQAYSDALEQIHQESQALNLQLQKKNQKFVEKLENEIFSIIDEILIKLSVRDNFSKHLGVIVKEELQKSNINKNEYLTITANKNVLKQLKNELTDSGDNIIFKLDDSLIDNECLYETNLYLMRININQLYSYLADYSFAIKSKPVVDSLINKEVV